MDPDLPILDDIPLRSLWELPGGAESVLEIIQIFEEDTPQRLAGIREAVAKGDVKAATMEAHSLKGGAGNLGLLRVAELGKVLEHQFRDRGDLACEPLLEELGREIPRALAALKAAFQA